MNILPWFDRQFTFGLQAQMLPFLLERLEGTVARLESKVKGIPESILSAQPGGKWSLKQHIGHLAEVDGIAGKRIQEMIDGISPMSPAVFEPRGDYTTQPVADVLAFFREVRQNNVMLYRSLTPEKLTRASLHPRLKLMMTPVDLAWFDAEHDDHHLAVMTHQLQSLSKQ